MPRHILHAVRISGGKFRWSNVLELPVGFQCAVRLASQCPSTPSLVLGAH